MADATTPPAGDMRLTMELVLSPCWYSNMRKVMTQAQWDTLRKQVYAEYGHHCGVCGVSNVMLHCHERWEYDDDAHVQRLGGFIALCEWCHHCKHVGLANILASKGRLDFEKVVHHFCIVNGCTWEDFKRHRDASVKVWRQRSQYQWQTELAGYATTPNEGITVAAHSTQQRGVSGL